mmetsp:Transcript_11262/g.12739  ORF Transcript_11262/g.12739 Transcript_11262/m.12739 type:complete len:245 (-) Transcript_11262:196-930(-)
MVSLAWSRDGGFDDVQHSLDPGPQPVPIHDLDEGAAEGGALSSARVCNLRWDGRRQETGPVLHHGADSTQAPKALWSRESARTAVLGAAEWEGLREVRGALQVVHGRHACMEPAADGGSPGLISRECTRAESEAAVVGHAHCFVVTVVGHAEDAHDGPEDLLLRNESILSYVSQHGGWVELTLLGELTARNLPPSKHSRSLGHRVVHQALVHICLLGQSDGSTVHEGRREGSPLLHCLHNIGHQ